MMSFPRPTRPRFRTLFLPALVWLTSLGGPAPPAAGAAPADLPPVVTAPASFTIAEGTLRSFTVSAADPDGDAIASLSAAPLPAGAVFTADASNTSGTFSWQPGFTQAGSYPVTFTASNALSGSAETVILVCNGCDRAPVVTAPLSETISLGSTLSFAVSAIDPDGDAIVSLTADVSGLPAGNDASFSANASNTQGQFAWTPAAGMEGTYVVTFLATNALTGAATTQITVAPAGTTPTVSGPATASTSVGVPLAFDVTANDPDGDPLVLTASSLPPGATFVDHGDGTGAFAWTPTVSQVGSYTVGFRATDPQGAFGDATTAITVLGANHPPVADAGGPYTGLLTIPVTLDGSRSYDPDGDPLTYAWDFGDGGMGSGVQVQHYYTVCGDYTATLTVTDPLGLSGTDTAPVAVCVTSCDARIFTIGGNQTIRLGSGKPTWCVEFEPGCFTIEDVVLSSFRMYYEGVPIHAIPEKIAIGADRDHNGVPELTACFSKGDLRSLFQALPSGRTDAPIVVAADTRYGVTLYGDMTITVVQSGGALAARITPTPLHGSGEISFVTRRAGPARVRIFDLQGRLVRTLLDQGSVPAGSHSVRVDARGRNGAPLAAGVYFYRIEADGTAEAGRMIIAR
jgi:hypothetical protein